MSSNQSRYPTWAVNLSQVFLLVPIEHIVMLVFMLGLSGNLPPTMSAFLYLFMAGFLIVGMVRIHLHQREIEWLQFKMDSAIDRLRIVEEVPGVWDSQRKLMRISGQDLPNYPMLTRGSILYGALITEELGETLMALGNAIEWASEGKNSQLYIIAKNYAKWGEMLKGQSSLFRESLAKCTEELDDLDTLPLDLAIDLLDGFTDLHVVVAGGSLATGLPGEEAYHEIVGSNLSKANPTTGLIDKTPDGKWIKGPNYEEPSLSGILRPYYSMGSL